MKRARTLFVAWTIAALVSLAGCAKQQPEPAKIGHPFAGQINQLGYIVPDLKEAMKQWLAQGVGPWYTLGPAMLQDNLYNGKPSSPRAIIALCQVGGVQLELIQPLDDEPSAYRDFLKSGKSGLQHFGFDVEENNYQAAVDKVIADGAKLQEKAQSMGNHFSYYYLAEPIGSPMERIQLGDVSPQKAEAVRKSVAGGCDIGELISVSKQVRDMFATVTDGAATWDGKTKPVRHLLSPLKEAAFNTIQLAEEIERWFKER